MNRIEKLTEFLQATPDDSFLKHALALEYIKAGNDADARNLFEELLMNDPDYVGSYYHLGKLLERAAEYEKAIQVYTNGILVAKKLGDAHAANELVMAKEEIEED
ncbi:MAG: hypothetical protein IPL97_14010 [Niastella sp.]|nr:hypothetical protein [Niastella sp.]